MTKLITTSPPRQTDQPGRRARRAMTFVELLVVLTILIPVVLIMTRLFFSGSAAYQATSWKQDKLTQAQNLLKGLGRDLEQASNKLVQSGPGLPPTETPQPLLFRPLPPPPPPPAPPPPRNGALMAFRRYHLNAVGNIEFIVDCVLSIAGDRLTYRRQFAPGSPTTPPAEVTPATIVLDSVAHCDITTQPVFIGPDGAEAMTVTPGPGIEEVGAVVNVSLTLRPPPNLAFKNIEVTENAKVKIHVRAMPGLNPAATAYP